ncbi:Hypothetical protein, putative, partial [Bodo saltans]
TAATTNGDGLATQLASMTAERDAVTARLAEVIRVQKRSARDIFLLQTRINVQRELLQQRCREKAAESSGSGSVASYTATKAVLERGRKRLEALETFSGA